MLEVYGSPCRARAAAPTVTRLLKPATTTNLLGPPCSLWNNQRQRGNHPSIVLGSSYPDPIQVEPAPKKFPSPRHVDRVPVEFAAAVGSIRGRRVGAVGSRRRSELAARFGGAVSGDRGQHQQQP
jgi:hypothetical protein